MDKTIDMMKENEENFVCHYQFRALAEEDQTWSVEDWLPASQLLVIQYCNYCF
jgi:hypothetical protein